MNLRDVIPTAENSSNFDVVPESITEVGTTLENLKAAVCGETGASAKYAACAAAAKEQGFDQIARLFEATSAAEQIHIGLEAGVIAEIEPGYERPAHADRRRARSHGVRPQVQRAVVEAHGLARSLGRRRRP